MSKRKYPRIGSFEKLPVRTCRCGATAHFRVELQLTHMRGDDEVFHLCGVCARFAKTAPYRFYESMLLGDIDEYCHARDDYLNEIAVRATKKEAADETPK